MPPLTSAERQRRYRAHGKGDHSLCDPERCVTTGVASPVTRDTSRTPRLGARGRRMWSELVDETSPPEPSQRVLIEEACRIADRLDRLDAQLRGDEEAWLKFVINEDASEVTVIIDRALSEARQQAVALKQLLGELRQSRMPAKAAPTPRSAVAKAAAESAPPGVASGGVVSDLTARIRDRERSAQASG